MGDDDAIVLADGTRLADWPSYEDLVLSLGVEILLADSDDEYQGDTRMLLRRGQEFGLLTFGWGSCSGCDALQGAYRDPEALGALREQLRTGVVWRESAVGLLAYIESKDWGLDFAYSPQFLDKVRRALDAVIATAYPPA